MGPLNRQLEPAPDAPVPLEWDPQVRRDMLESAQAYRDDQDAEARDALAAEQLAAADF